jgi:hypothetical protein
MPLPLKIFVIFFWLLQLSGCSLVTLHATGTRMEEARAANAGKQLIPKDSGSYLISVGAETASYLGSGDTDWKVSNTSFTQPKGTYSLIRAVPGAYAVYGNKRVAGGGEATSVIDVRASEVTCFYVFNPMSGAARIETYKGDACDPILRPLRQQSVVDKVN